MADLEKPPAPTGAASPAETSAPTPAADPVRVSRAQLRRTLRAGRASNADFLTVAAPTAAATKEQVAALTVQVQALIRYTLGE